MKLWNCTQLESSEAEALKTRSILRGSHTKREVTWKQPQFCTTCETWFAEFDWNSHQQKHHARDNLAFDCSMTGWDPDKNILKDTILVQGVQISGLSDGKCPFDGCPEPFRDFTGWYLHCTMEHDYISKHGGHAPRALSASEKARMPTFRCTTCFACLPIGRVQRHRAQCPAFAFPETVGPCNHKMHCSKIF